MARLKEYYVSDVAPALMKKFKQILMEKLNMKMEKLY